tara:strand:+ start:372 stop:545 length:174 start_codon:yes stop_codon:yes gene_type:complete
MIYYKECIKCGGDMHIRQDTYGEFKECVQCGKVIDLSEIPVTVSSATAEATKSNEAA